MISRVFKLLAFSLILSCGFEITATAQDASTRSISAEDVSNTFVKKRYSIQGGWTLLQANGETQIQFSDDFKTKGGPDLKVYLSKVPIEQLDSKTAGQNSVRIGVLKSKSGGQTYTVPSDVDLADYKSVIIHCEAFSVLWGGFDLPVTATNLISSTKP